jgi:arylsulfatase A-like enzyme
MRLIASCTFLILAFAANASSQTRPNVVLIMMDDVGYGDYGSYGGRDIRTPNIDRLAKDGVRFTDFYAAPNCSPTRAALISGRYQQRSNIEAPLGNASTAARDLGLRPTGRSLPQLLKNSGYTTGLIGKWHLGYKTEYQPNAHGFDYFFGFLSGYIDYYQHTGGDGLHDLFENGSPVHVDGYSTDLITERSIRFIEQHASGPFFLDVSYNAAHWPFQVPDKPSVAARNAAFVQPTDGDANTRREYAAIVERADAGVGRIMDTLQRLGLARNTLVIFTNDNGGEWLSRNAPLFHRKSTVWEGGVRVPLLMRWPGRLPAGRVEPQVGIVMDLTATILAATGSPVPPDARLDGINLLPIVERRAPRVERTLFFRLLGAARTQRAVRQGDWKLLVEPGHTMLFNLRDDIGERHDLARDHLDIVQRLRPLIAAWEKDVDTEAKASANYVVPGGPAGPAGGQPAGRGRGQSPN